MPVCLMFLIMKLNQPNFLILDEPTNHIDIQGKEELEDQILTSNATVLVTSHDRRFIDHIAQRFFLISNGRLVEINHPDTFYQLDPVEHPVKIDVKAEQISARSEEEILARIIELEELLTADQAREPKFHKPALQADWQAQLVKLNAQLDS